MNQKLTIFTTCTNRKNVSAEVGCQLREYAGEDSVSTLGHWIDALKEVHPRVPVRDLYQGSHWSSSMRCIESARQLGFDTTFWILSAGWGILHPDEKIPSYDATFSTDRKVEDRIHVLDWSGDLTNLNKAQEWWTGLRGHHKESPRKLVDVPGIDTGINLFIISQEYYEAIEPELLELSGLNPNLLLVSAGLYSTGKVHQDLKQFLPPFTFDFQLYRQTLNNTNISLNADLASWIMNDCPGELAQGLDQLMTRIREVADSLPDASTMERDLFIDVARKIGSDLSVPNLGKNDSLEEFWDKRNKSVVKMTDDEVLAFIAEHFDPDTSSASVMLTQLRHEKKASCEQKRFRGLFRRFQEEYRKKNNSQMELF